MQPQPTQDQNDQQEGSEFPSLGGELRSSADLLYRAADSVFPSEKRGACEEAQILMTGLLGVTFCQAGPRRMCSVCGFTGHGSHFSWEAARRKDTVQV